MLHTEPVQHLDKEVIAGVPVSGIELVILETVSDHQILRTEVVDLPLQTSNCLHQSL